MGQEATCSKCGQAIDSIGHDGTMSGGRILCADCFTDECEREE